MHIAEPERDRLRAQTAATRRAVDAPALLAMRRTPAIEITKAHPGSLPQFITGRSTLLSNLFRDEVALRTARLAAERITAKNLELRTARGLERRAPRRRARLVADRRTRLHARRCCCARSRSAGITPTSSSSCTARSSVNPELVRALRTHFGIEVDGAGARRARPRRRRLQAAAGHRPPARADRRRSTRSPSSRAWSCRASPTSAAPMARDAADLDHPILNALAGHPDDRESLTAVRDAPRRREPGRAPAGRRHAAARCRRRAGGACSPGSPPGSRSPSTRSPAPAARRPSSTPSARSCATASACSS